MSEDILIQTMRGIATFTFNRPKARNAMSVAMVNMLTEGLSAAESDPSVRAVVLRGSGGNFCAGGDIKDMAAARMAPLEEGAPDPIQALSASFGRVALRFARSPLPIVAAVEGAVMGGGFGIACTADVVLASTTAEFRLPETSLGVLPAQIAPFLVERLGYSEAKRLSITGARLDARAAHRVGLVHEVVEPTELEAVLTRTLDQILVGSPGGTRATKQLLFHLFGRLTDEDIQHAAALFATAARGDEAAEGMQAFIEKRKPKWAGG